MQNKTFDELVLELPHVIKRGDVEYHWRLIRLSSDMFDIGYFKLNNTDDNINVAPVLFYQLGKTPTECLIKLIEQYKQNFEK